MSWWWTTASNSAHAGVKYPKPSGLGLSSASVTAAGPVLAHAAALRAFAPRGAFYVWAELDPELYSRLGVADADMLSSKLALSGIGSAPGDAFGDGCHDAIRFAFSCDTGMVRAGAVLLRAALTGETPL